MTRNLRNSFWSAIWLDLMTIRHNHLRLLDHPAATFRSKTTENCNCRRRSSNGREYRTILCPFWYCEFNENVIIFSFIGIYCRSLHFWHFIFLFFIRFARQRRKKKWIEILFRLAFLLDAEQFSTSNWKLLFWSERAREHKHISRVGISFIRFVANVSVIFELDSVLLLLVQSAQEVNAFALWHKTIFIVVECREQSVILHRWFSSLFYYYFSY